MTTLHRLTITMAAAAMAAALAAPAAAQTQQAQQPNLLMQGLGAAMYGRCNTDYMTPDMRNAAAALAALAPMAASRIAPADDPLEVIVGACAQQLHQHRCSAKIVAVAGDMIGAGRPGSGAAPPPVNPMAVFGGVVGGVLGVIGGNAVADTPGAVGLGALGAYKGAQIGGKAQNAAQAANCTQKRQQLDAISERLGGSVRPISYAGIVNLIEANRQARRIDDQEAALLRAEVSQLANRASAVLKALR